jgi:uncharacterized iron-regulated membrane protein
MTLKSVLMWIHRWLGLTLGVVFAVVALSGTLLLFQPQFFRWTHGEMIPGGLSPVPGSVDRWVDNARAAVPGLHGPIAIWPPHFDHNVSDAGMLIFDGRAPGGLGNTGFAAVLVAPATGEVLGVVDVDRSPAYAPLFLHGQLWAGGGGALVIGIVAISALLSLPMGLYLWWPRSRLLAKLSPRPWRSTLTHAGRLHNWTGAWTVLLLFIVAGTGLYMVQPEWVEPVLGTLQGPSDPAGSPSSACAPTTFDGAIERANALVPGATWKALEPQDAALKSWEITMTGASLAQQRQTHVLADLECGGVAVSETPAKRSARSTVELWLRGVHEGSAFGTLGEVFMALVGLVPLVLVWSGARLWLRRRARAGA